ncbi:MAG: hypothetical protein LBR91_03765 [Puniceicoccales bacterium]|nr:hypothetical protein [Puniceicoccales bacterium]
MLFSDKITITIMQILDKSRAISRLRGSLAVFNGVTIGISLIIFVWRN